MLNSLFAGILAQYGMSEGQVHYAEPQVENAEVENAEVENAEVENAEVENAEVENAEVENAEVENAEVENTEVESARFRSWNKMIKGAEYVVLKVENVPFEILDVYHEEQYTLIDVWIEKHKEAVNSMTLEVLCFTEDEIAARRLALSAYKFDTGDTARLGHKEYKGAGYFILDRLLVNRKLSDYNLKCIIINTMFLGYKGHYTTNFIG
jgi:hypothetical protein